MDLLDLPHLFDASVSDVGHGKIENMATNPGMDYLRKFECSRDHDSKGAYVVPPEILPIFNPYCFENHYIGQVKSQLNPAVWEFELQFEHDSYLKSYLLDGVNNGFRIVNENAVIEGYEMCNYSSVYKDCSCEMINESIKTGLLDGKYMITEEKPVCVHALGVIAQHHKQRIITDCSRPSGVAINEFMSQVWTPFKYNTVDNVAQLMTQGCYMCTIDITSAYRTIPVRQDNWKYQGVNWAIDGQQTYLVDTHLCFGLRCAPYIFSRISDFIVNCMKRRGVQKIINYLDDFIIFGDDYESCVYTQRILIRLLITLGFAVSYKKCTTPATTTLYLGIIFDSIAMELRIPEEKMERLYQELQFFEGRNRCTKRQLQKFCGIIAHVTKIIKGGRTFSRRLIERLKGLPEGNTRIRLSSEFHKDLYWWQEFARSFNGLSVYIPENEGGGLWYATDASQKGYGIWSDRDWQGGYFDTEKSPSTSNISINESHNHWFNVNLQEWPIEDVNINFLELIPIYLGLQRLTSRYRDAHILCYTDNTQCCSMINKGVSTNKSCMSLLREIFWLCVLSNCYLSAVHIPGIDNHIPDRISRIADSELSDVLENFMCCSASTSSDR